MNIYRTRNASKALVTLLLTALLPLCPTTGTALEFASPVSYPVGASPTAAVIADFNGDGHSDIAVANFGSGDVSILLGKGDGTYKPAVNIDAGMTSPTSIAVADFNNDGIQDLAVWSLSGPIGSTLSILLGNGDGTFQAPKTTPLPAAVDQATLDLVVADFNLDRKPDLALLVNDANAGTSRIFLLAGNGDGTLQAPQQGSIVLSTIVGSNVRYLATGDFNNDGKPDLAVQVAGGIEILLGQGDGTFHAGVTIPIGGGLVVSDLKLGDFNGDGQVDVLAKSDNSIKCGPFSIGKGAASKISLFLGNGDGSFKAEQPIDNAQSCKTLGVSRGSAIGVPSAEDFNGDGRLDLEYQVSTSTLLSGVRLGRMDGQFSVPIPLPALPWGVSFIAKDLNGDKLSDLIYLDSDNSAAIILLNTSPTSGADLGIIKATAGQPLSDSSSSWYPADGRSFSYGAEILNEGPEDATGVTYTGTLPAGVTFVSATATQGTCSQSSGTVSCAIGSMASALDATVTVAVTLNPTPKEETLSSNMKVKANESDLDLANNTATPGEPVFTLTVSSHGTGSGTVTGTAVGLTGTGGIPAGINCGGTCVQGYLSGSNISLTATPAPGSVFTGWDGSTSGGADTVAMWGSQTVRATFDKAAHPPIPSGGGSGGGGACGWWELCAMLLVGLWRRLSGSHMVPRDERGVWC